MAPLSYMEIQLMQDATQLLTAEDLASRLRLQPETIRLWTREHMIPALRITDKVIRYDMDEVIRALRKRSDERMGTGVIR